MSVRGSRKRSQKMASIRRHGERLVLEDCRRAVPSQVQVPALVSRAQTKPESYWTTDVVRKEARAWVKETQALVGGVKSAIVAVEADLHNLPARVESVRSLNCAQAVAQSIKEAAEVLLKELSEWKQYLAALSLEVIQAQAARAWASTQTAGVVA